MRRHLVLLEIVWEEQPGRNEPQDWLWDVILDMHPDEGVRVVRWKETTDNPNQDWKEALEQGKQEYRVAHSRECDGNHPFGTPCNTGLYTNQENN